MLPHLVGGRGGWGARSCRQPDQISALAAEGRPPPRIASPRLQIASVGRTPLAKCPGWLWGLAPRTVLHAPRPTTRGLRAPRGADGRAPAGLRGKGGLSAHASSPLAPVPSGGAGRAAAFCGGLPAAHGRPRPGLPGGTWPLTQAAAGRGGRRTRGRSRPCRAPPSPPPAPAPPLPSPLPLLPSTSSGSWPTTSAGWAPLRGSSKCRGTGRPAVGSVRWAVAASARRPVGGYHQMGLAPTRRLIHPHGPTVTDRLLRAGNALAN